MKAIVTGSSGFIGSRLCSFLEKEGCSFVRVSRSTKVNPSTDLVCDLERNEIGEGILSDVNTIFHLAGHAHDLSNPEKSKSKYIRLNIDATKNLALQASTKGVKTFVFISSVKAELQDNFSNRPSIKSQGIYGETKRKAELELIELSKQTNMKICIVRPSLVYGPNLKGNLLSMKKAIQNGWFPPLPKMQNKRSMVHVDDLVKAILIVKEKGENGEIYNVTDGKDYSSTEIYESFYEMIQKLPPKYRVPLLVLKALQYMPGSAGMNISKLIGDENYSSTKIQSLGFEAKLRFKDLDEALF